MSASLASFQQSVRLFDPLLSVRRGIQFTDQYVIERKAYLPPTEIFYLKRRADRLRKFANQEQDPAKQGKLINTWKQLAEEYEAARHGKRVVIFAEALDRRVFDRLAVGDIQRYGGYSRFADEMEKAEREKELALERDLARMRDDQHSESFDKLNFAFRKKDSNLMHWDRKESLTELIR